MYQQQLKTILETIPHKSLRYLGMNVTKDGLNFVKKNYKAPQIQMIVRFTKLQ